MQVKTFVVLDLDRTLLDSDALVELLYDTLVELGVSKQKLVEDKEHIAAQTGTSFSLIDYMVHEYGDDVVAMAMQKIKQDAADGLVPAELLLCPGAERLLNYLNEGNIPHAILTYGEANNQEFKLDVVRSILGKTPSELHATITAESKKAAWIEETWARGEDNGHLHVPRAISGSDNMSAKNVLIIDDKVSNLASKDRAVKGILVNNQPYKPAGQLSTEQLVDYLETGALSLERIAALQSLNAA